MLCVKNFKRLRKEKLLLEAVWLLMTKSVILIWGITLSVFYFKPALAMLKLDINVILGKWHLFKGILVLPVSQILLAPKM